MQSLVFNIEKNEGKVFPLLDYKIIQNILDDPQVLIKKLQKKKKFFSKYH